MAVSQSKGSRAKVTGTGLELGWNWWSHYSLLKIDVPMSIKCIRLGSKFSGEGLEPWGWNLERYSERMLVDV